MGSATTHPEGRARALLISGFPSVYVYTVCCRNTNLTWYTCGEGTCFRGQPRPRSRGGPPCSTTCRFRSIYAYTVCFRTTKFDVVTYVGEGVVFGSATLPIPRERSSRASNFWGFSTSVVMHTPFNAERPNSACFQPRHCIYINASRSLSATAEFLVYTKKEPYHFGNVPAPVARGSFLLY